MSQYIFKSIKDPDNKFDISDITFEVETVSKSELVDQFILFMEACGYNMAEDREELGL